MDVILKLVVIASLFGNLEFLSYFVVQPRMETGVHGDSFNEDFWQGWHTGAQELTGN